jgi:hypothetical protein
MLQIGSYWINPQHIVYCKDSTEPTVHTLTVYLTAVGGAESTYVHLQGADRDTMLGWLHREARTAREEIR